MSRFSGRGGGRRGASGLWFWAEQHISRIFCTGKNQAHTVIVCPFQKENCVNGTVYSIVVAIFTVYGEGGNKIIFILFILFMSTTNKAEVQFQ